MPSPQVLEKLLKGCVSAVLLCIAMLGAAQPAHIRVPAHDARGGARGVEQDGVEGFAVPPARGFARVAHHELRLGGQLGHRHVVGQLVGMVFLLRMPVGMTVPGKVNAERAATQRQVHGVPRVRVLGAAVPEHHLGLGVALAQRPQRPTIGQRHRHALDRWRPGKGQTPLQGVLVEVGELVLHEVRSCGVRARHDHSLTEPASTRSAGSPPHRRWTNRPSTTPSSGC